MANQVTVYESTLSKQLARQWSKNRAEPDLKWAAEKRYALDILRKSEVLQKSSPESFAMAMLDVAFTGLSLSPTLGLAYLIPYWNKLTSSYEVQFKPSYKGMQQLVYKAGTVRDANAMLVRAKDSFQVQTLNNRRVIHHVEHSGPNDEVIAAYAIITYTNGGEHVEVMNRSELNAVEAQAKATKGGGAVWNGPWKGEMQKKAVLRRGLKHAPLDNGGRLEKAIAIADKYDPVDFEPVAHEPDKPQELLVSLEQGMVIHAILTEGGLTSEQANGWMEKLGEAMGYAKFDDLPASRFEEAKTRIVERLHKWQQARPA